MSAVAVRARAIGDAVPVTAVSSEPLAAAALDGDAWRDAQPATVRCSFCPAWSFAGPAAEARASAAAHRDEHHPELAERPHRLGRDEARRRALPAVARRRRQREPTWGREQALDRLAAFVGEHHRPPTMSEAVPANGMPSHSVQERLFGSFGGYVEAGGHPRPARGRPKGPGSRARAEDARAAVRPPAPPAAPQANRDGHRDALAGEAACGSSSTTPTASGT